MGTAAGGSAGARQIVVGLDILRLFAALLVVAFHFLHFSWTEPAGHGGLRDVIGADIAFPGATAFSWWGWVGVELFFVISGFVISMSANGKTATAFAIGRISRLYPALLFFSACSFLVIAGAGLLPAPAAFERWLRALLLFPKGPWIDGVIWTLVVEAVFYFLIFLLILSGNIARLGAFARAGLAIVSIFWALVLLSHMVDLQDAGVRLQSLATDYSAKLILLTTGAFFLVGIFSYEMFDRGVTAERGACAMLAAGCGLVSIWHTAATTRAVTMLGQSPLVPMAVWLATVLVCGLVIAAERRRPAGARYRALARRIGLITYPLYLVHNITGGWIMGRLRDAGLAMAAAASLALLACLGASYLFAMLVEPPLQRVLRQWLQLEFMPQRSRA